MNPSTASACPSPGLIGWLEDTRIVLPLKGVEVRFDLAGDLLEVELDQIYHQNQKTALDVIYTFPLPGGAAVYRCEMHVNGRIIAAKAMPSREAYELAEARRTEGYRTALVESLRDNLFELALGNLAPGDTVVIRLGYVQTLDRDGEEGAASFRIPLTPGVRYIPGEPLLRPNQGKGIYDDTDQVPDASRISPPRLDALDADAAYLAFAGLLDATGWNVEALSSPSHPLLVHRDDERVRVSLAGGGQVPDRDIVVRLTASSEGAVEAGWSQAHEGYTYAAVRLVAPPVTARTAERPRDFFFLIDRSGSMQGIKWTHCARAFREFLRRMGPLDRASVTFFESAFQDFGERPLPAAAILAEPMIAKLEELATGGGTELLPALVHVLAKVDRHCSPERETTLVILTDGQVGNEKAIHDLLEARRGTLRVHTFGIDTAVNDAFLRKLATDHGGACSLASPGDDIPGLVAGIARRFGGAVVRGLRVTGPWEGTGEAPSAFWEGDAVTLAVRLEGSSPEVVVVVGESAEDGAEVHFLVPLVASRSAAPRLLWQRQKIREWEKEGRWQEATTLACAANLLSSGTSFVAWDEAERVACAGPSLSIYQPSLAPAPAFAAPLCSPLPKATVKLSEMPVWSGFRALIPQGRAPEPPALEPCVLASGAPEWAAPLVKALGLPEPRAIRLTDWLEQWLWMDPDQTEARRKLLVKLGPDLGAVKHAERTARFLAWLELYVAEPILGSIKLVVNETGAVA